MRESANRRPKHIGGALFGLLCALGSSTPGLCTDAQAQVVRTPRERVEFPHATPAPTIDGRLVSTEWSQATAVELPYETQRSINGPAPVLTDCYVMKDEERLYVGCRGRDPSPGSIRAQYVDRDKALGHDRITLYLDPFDDGQRAFVFSVSAVGVQSDGIFDQVRGDTDYSWNTVWESGGRITDSGFEVEFGIPFRSLRFPRSAGAWRFVLEREWPRSQALTLRSTTYDPNDACRMCHTQHFEPGRITRSGSSVEAIPTLTAARTGRVGEPGAPFMTGSVAPEIGLDVRWGLTSQAGANVTINPDFSQIEADALQLESNSRFALSVPERRPFFLEDSEVFQSPLRAVFTRSIQDPVAGAKLAGRSGDWSGGMLFVRDRQTHLLIPGSFGSTTDLVDGHSNAWTGRLSRTLAPGVVVGGLFTHRTGAGYRNSVAGLDAFLRPVRALEVRTQLLGSWTGYPARISANHNQNESLFRDHAFVTDARFDTRNWSAQVRFQSTGEAFRADLGFIPRVDLRRFESFLTRRVWGPPGGWLTQLFASLGQWNVKRQNGTLKERGIWSQIGIVGPWQSRLAANPYWATERFAGVEYSRSGINVQASVAPNPDLFFTFQGRWASVIDYANERLANSRDLGGNSEFRFGRRLSFEVSANRRVIRYRELLVTKEDIFRVKSLLGLSSRAFFSVLAQVRSVTRDPAAHTNTVVARGASVEMQGFFTYRLDGQTAMFVGYSERQSDARMAVERLDLERQSATWFLKLSYAWRP